MLILQVLLNYLKFCNCMLGLLIIVFEDYVIDSPLEMRTCMVKVGLATDHAHTLISNTLQDVAACAYNALTDEIRTCYDLIINFVK